jgi:hypothetical protein
MPLLRTKTTTAPFTQSSNYAGNSSASYTAQYEQDIGSGVQRRTNWRRLPQPARSAPVNYNKSWEKEDRGRVSFSHTESSGTSSFYLYQNGPYNSSLFPTNSEIPGILSEAGYAAKVKLFSELKGEGTNLANMLGERRQIANSVANAVNTLVYTVRDLRRGNISSAIRRMGGDPLTARKLRGKDISNQLLSLRYGWLPLMDDVYGLVNGLHKRETLQPKVFRCSSKRAAVKPSDSSWAYMTPMKGGPTRNMGIRSTTAIQKYMLRVWPDAVLAEPAALGLTNPLVVAWEVTPWSFVADWFIPVGRYLEQLTAAHGWHFHDGCVSTLVKSNELAEYTDVHNYTSAGWSYTNVRRVTGLNCSYVRFDRSGLSGFPTPDVPRFKNPFSVEHVQNSIALLSQVISGKRK